MLSDLFPKVPSSYGKYIVSFTLKQFQKYFVAMFERNQARPEHLRDLNKECEIKRDILNTVEWKQSIESVVSKRISALYTGIKRVDRENIPIVHPGSTINHVSFGVGQVVGVIVSFPNIYKNEVKIPYLNGLPDVVSINTDGITLCHERFWKGKVYAYIVVFKDTTHYIPFPSYFRQNVSVL